MANKKPLYIENGRIQEYGSGDTIDPSIAPGSGGGGGGKPWWFNPPLSRDFTTAGSSPYLSYSDDDDVGLICSLPASSTGQHRIIVRNLSDYVSESGNWDFVVRTSSYLSEPGNVNMGAVLRNPSTGRFYLIGSANGSNYFVDVTSWTSPTAFSSRVGSLPVGLIDNRGWFRIRRNSGDYEFGISPNGKEWRSWSASTSWLGTSGLQVGLSIFSSSVTGPNLSCDHFTVTQI